MRVGVPAEVKREEYRVALTPDGAREFVAHGHEVLVQSGAGRGSRLPDAAFQAAGARIVADAEEAWAADMVVKVKEPVAEEYRYLRPGLLLLTYLHLAATRDLTLSLLEHDVVGIAYETIQEADGSLPLLAPMSEVAGRMATQVGAGLLTRPAGGRGVLMGGVAGVDPARVLVLGAGVAGSAAAAIAVGMRADVTIINRGVPRLRHLDEVFSGQVRTLSSTVASVEEQALQADLVIGAVLVPGGRAPVLVSNDLVAEMKPGSVLVDISVDQGGCFEDSRPTTHDDPTFSVHDSLFYCVANMPGAVPVTATRALTNVTLGYALTLAEKGWEAATRDDVVLRRGVNTVGGDITNQGVADAHGLPYTPFVDPTRTRAR